ncbi:MAG: pyrroline-5-carboxylate reductase, partial [Alphaproteobacteria bacterium]|nr:pyrroline-5-carboxylate reductase [Alphaproteobacteria bacterium]
MAHVILVGAGNMGSAMLSRWIRNSADEFSVIEPSESLRARAAETGAAAYATPEELPRGTTADVIVIATKPQLVEDVGRQYRNYLAPDGVWISVAAGTTISSLAKCVGASAAIVRCMPNTPAIIGEAMVVCCANEHVTQAQRAVAHDLMKAIGKVASIDDEGLMNAVTAVSGSGPAYVFHFIEALAQAAVHAGINQQLALTLAKQTLFGAAKLAIESPDEPATLRQRVTSPNGTTAAALTVLMREQGGLLKLIDEAVQAAIPAPSRSS